MFFFVEINSIFAIKYNLGVHNENAKILNWEIEVLLKRPYSSEMRLQKRFDYFFSFKSLKKPSEFPSKFKKCAKGRF